ncbi:conserved hypothetical protein [Latilactobacillus sakei]|nr:hypothetical protein LS25_0069 [Latilactobacillus sakei subsp. sakei LS25]SOB37603.1 conserved hypothetical protein [Latilactobacillus sakei]SOB39676.1 conserved hypothetical protein [Latilactobacillus sakei]SOB42033.1 conserved hypothetical protein [Latilactobacillus sakei]SON64271.1 conserved protein of unknown function [Latilactobacillus sakei]
MYQLSYLKSTENTNFINKHYLINVLNPNDDYTTLIQRFKHEQ